MAQSRKVQLILAACLMLITASCSFNPFRKDNELTGSPTSTAVGVGVGAGAAALAGASKAEIGLAGLAGGLVGYYVSTLRFASGGVMHAGGQVYTLGQNVTIAIPSDQLFDTNSAELLPGAGAILDSVVAILDRYPNNNILISGNTSGYYSAKIERKLSEDRAKQVAAYLWAHGINNFEAEIGRNRKLSYVGYSNYFPIANDIKPKGIQQNSRIQITSYPSKKDLGIDKKSMVFNNIGDSNDDYKDTANKDTAAQSLSGETTRLPGSNPPGDQSFAVASNEPSNVKGEMWDDYNTITDDQPSNAPSAPANSPRFKDQ